MASGRCDSACRETGLRFVILRPGDRPRAALAMDRRALRALSLDGSAYVVAGGRGICNAIYVDNLVHAVDLALEREEAAGETFLVADDGAVSWRMLYEPVCRALGCSWDSVADLAPRVPRLMPAERLLGLKDDPTARVVLDRVPRTLRDPVRRLAVRRLGEESPQGTSRRAPLEDSILQTCGYRFPTAKARRLLGFEPPVSFDEASRRTVGWLGFAGYPVAASAQEVAPDGIASRLGRDDRPRRRAVPRRGARQRSRPDLPQPRARRRRRRLDRPERRDCGALRARRARTRPARSAHADGGSRGMSAARTLGVRTAQGDLIAFLDADDVWLPEKIARAGRRPRAAPGRGDGLRPHADVAQLGRRARRAADYFYDLGVEPDRLYPPLRLLPQLLENRVQSPDHVQCPHPPRAYEEAGGFEKTFSGLYEDQVFFAKLYLSSATYVSSRFWARYRRHETNEPRRRFSYARYYRERRAFLEWLAENLGDAAGRRRRSCDARGRARASAAPPPRRAGGATAARRRRWSARAARLPRQPFR